LDNQRAGQFLTLRGEKIYYEEDGTGLPLLLLHAGVADSRMWAAQVEALAPHYRVIRCDLRGYGNSPLPNGAFAYHEDVAALLDALNIDAAWIVGASFGGRVAVDFALTYPQRVDGLILAAPLLSGYEPGESIQAFGEEEDTLLEDGDLDGATELNLRMWVDGPFRRADQVDPQVRAGVAEMQRHAFNMEIPEKVAVHPIDPPAMARLPEIHAPTLILVGDLDVAEVVEFAETLAQVIPNAQQRTIPGVAHLPNMEAPQIFNEAVEQFIQTTGKQSK
jgi:pimeloyl-ACP methyl ester carboxylesterase